MILGDGRPAYVREADVILPRKSLVGGSNSSSGHPWGKTNSKMCSDEGGHYREWVDVMKWADGVGGRVVK